MRFNRQAEKMLRAASMLATIIILVYLAQFFLVCFFCCLILIWKHAVWQIAVPFVEDKEADLIAWCCFGIAIMAVYGMRKQLRAVFRGKPWKWYAVLILPLLVVEAVAYTANWGAQYGILYRSGGNMGLYYDQIFGYAGWVILSGLSLFAVGAYVFGMHRIYVEQQKAERYQMQAAVYQTLEEQYRHSERLRHDLKNHVLALQGLWEEQAWEKLGDYLKRMEDSAQLRTNEEATGNRAMDALLCQKRKMAEERGILWECSVQIPRFCQIDTFDLCVLFGNILDNAVEACDRLKDSGTRQDSQPFIHVRAEAVKKCFLLEVKNSMNAVEQKKGGPLGKENPQGHGIGLLNVGDVVRRYNGVLNTEMQNAVYDISILLPLGEAAYDTERAV